MPAMRYHALYLTILVAIAAVLGMGARSILTPDLLDTSGLHERFDPDAALSGGATTIHDTSMRAFGRIAANLGRDRWLYFGGGRALFTRDWTFTRKGFTPLGPYYNAVGCSGCHLRDGRGRPPLDARDYPGAIVMQLGEHDGAGSPYGRQLRYLAVDGTPPQGSVSIGYREIIGHFADGEPYILLKPSYRFGDLTRGKITGRFSPRVAPVTFGLGLLEAIPWETILSYADPDDRDGDGISGRANFVPDIRTGRPALGRFGWKANQATIEGQIATALNLDLGITTSLLPHDDALTAGSRHATADTAELGDDDLRQLLFYVRNLAVPAPRGRDDHRVRFGAALFEAIGCSSCHRPATTTGRIEDAPELSGQRIYPYTDLLLHDMGEGLADGRPDGLADGREWRTPPLWGLGLVRRVNDHTRFLHDGRARNIEEAILWHGGEGSAARRRYLHLRREDRAALLAFMESL